MRSNGKTLKATHCSLLCSDHNEKKETDATKLEFNGRFDDVTVNVWHAVREAFHHAFVKAIPEKLENSIEFHRLKQSGKK